MFAAQEQGYSEPEGEPAATEEVAADDVACPVVAQVDTGRAIQRNQQQGRTIFNARLPYQFCINI